MYCAKHRGQNIKEDLILPETNNNLQKNSIKTIISLQFSSVVSGVWIFTIPWTAVRQASLSITNSWSLLKLMSIQLVMPSNHLILCCPLLLLPSMSQDGLVWSPCSPRGSQESFRTPQFKRINSLALSFLYSLTLASIHDHWKIHSFD